MGKLERHRKFRLFPIPTEMVRSVTRLQVSDLSNQIDEDEPITGVLGCGYHLGAGPTGEFTIHMGIRQRENEP